MFKNIVRKAQRSGRKNREIYNEDIQISPNLQDSGSKYKDISNMSVDEIIQNAMLRRQKENKQLSPPTHDYVAGGSLTRDDSGSKQFFNQVSPFSYNNKILHNTPAPIYSSHKTLNNEANLSKSYNDDYDNNDLIERKVEDILKKIIGNSQMSSIHGSRESSIIRNPNDGYWQQNTNLYNIPQQNSFPGVYNSIQQPLGLQNQGFNGQATFNNHNNINSQPNMINNDLIHMK